LESYSDFIHHLPCSRGEDEDVLGVKAVWGWVGSWIMQQPGSGASLTHGYL